ncbi:MAG: L-threonylcarbamoyladenylate synthase [Ferruginibacter sp.]
MNFDDDLTACAQILNKGGIILYPTDTIWGLGCDATNKPAVTKIFALKQREEKKSMIILLDTENCIGNYCKAPSLAIKKILSETVSPLTIIYPGAKNLATNLINEDGTIAIRIVKDAFCEALLKSFGKPIVSTSANISGEASPGFFGEVSVAMKIGADYIVKHRQNDATIAIPSKIILWKNDEEIVVIRE